MADGAVKNTHTLSAQNNWTWTWTDLPKEKTNGTVINYTVEEVYSEELKNSGYELPVISGSKEKGFVITNKRVQELVEVPFEKIWDDNSNQDGKRPSEITVRLLADGQEIEAKAVTGSDRTNDRWSGSFTDLPKYNNVKFKDEEVNTSQENNKG